MASKTFDMVPDDCFLRKLPIGLSLVQRMKFDGLRVAADIVGLANSRLISIALHICRDEQLKPSGISRTALLLDAWSVISHCHTIRKILTSREFDTPEITSFITATEQVSKVRDAQQHYHDLLPNRAKKKSKTAPLYGALTWTYAKDPPPITGLFLVTCSSGAMLEPKWAVNVSTPCGQDIRLPIGHIHLQAFDSDIDLQGVTNEVSSLVLHLNTQVAGLVREQLDKIADEKKIDRATLHANAAADLFIALWAKLEN